MNRLEADGDEATYTMDPPTAVRRSRSDSSSSRRKTAGVVRALKELSKRPWLPSPLDAAARWLTPSYDIKNEDFRRLFKALPPSSMLLDDYSCALQRDILVHGRMYVSQEYVSFYANIFGWETIVVVPLKSISSITREKTAHVFPNALQILLKDGVEINGTFSSEPKAHNDSMNSDGGEEKTASSSSSADAGDPPVNHGAGVDRSTLHNKLWFTSFVSRDTSHTVLMKAWQNVLVDSPLSPVQLRNFACRCWGEKPDASPEIARALMSGSSLVGVSEPSEAAAADSASAAQQARCQPIDEFEVLSSIDVEEKGDGSVDGSTATESLASDPEADEPVECGCTEHYETYMDESFNGPVDFIFQLLFTNSEFYKVFCRQHKTIDLRMQEWTPTDGDGQHREVTYTLTLNKTMGPKFSPTTETQHCLEGSMPGKMYRVDVEVCNGGIPYGDVFCTEHRYCLTRLSRHQAHIHVGARIHYRKSCWGLVKTFIERHCFQGMENYYNDLCQNLHDECLKLPTPTDGPVQNLSRSSRPPSLSGSLASIPREKTPTPSLYQEPLDNGASIRRSGRVSTPDGSLPSKSSMATSSTSSVATCPDSAWTVSNILLLCLLLALVVNIALLLRLSLVSNSSSVHVLPGHGLDSHFSVQRDQWRLAMIRRQELLAASYNAFPLSTGGGDGTLNRYHSDDAS